MDTVLLVEEDELSTRRMSWILFEAGYRVVPVTRPGDAASAARQARPDVMVVNTQLDRPAKRRLLAELRQAHRAPIIDLHTHAQDSGHAGHAEAALHKPFDADSLVELVDGLVMAGSVTPPRP